VSRRHPRCRQRVEVHECSAVTLPADTGSLDKGGTAEADYLMSDRNPSGPSNDC
jgi:hypothetical protein